MELQRKTIRVMLVDDHQTMLWGLIKLIETEKPRMEVVGTAQTGPEALEKIAQLSPDVLLLDLDLGGSSALDLLPALQSNPQLRVLIFTGERDQEKLDLAVFRGARGIVRKDASAELLLKAIEKQLRVKYGWTVERWAGYSVNSWRQSPLTNRTRMPKRRPA